MKNIIKQIKNETTSFITNEEAKKILLGEMLKTWQPLAALACRCGLTNEMAYRLLEELEIDGKITSSSFRINGKNKARAYKLITYIKVMSQFLPMQSNSLELCESAAKHRGVDWYLTNIKISLKEKLGGDIGLTKVQTDKIFSLIEGVRL